VTNTADRPAREVVQLYVDAPETSVPRPERELVGFKTLRLSPDERRRVSLSIPRRRLARYALDAGWVVDAGTYELAVGRSSRDLRARESVGLDPGGG
jgi:beta-glucosidase